MKIIESAKQALEQKDFKKLEDLWTDMVLEQSVTLNTFFEIAKALGKLKESERALTLLEMLASHLESSSEYKKAIEVYKSMLYHKKDDNEIRKIIVNLYKKSYKDNEHLNEFIEISGFNKGDPIFKAINKLDEFLKYDIGRYFYFERYGVGQVIDVIPLKREIVIDFEKKKRHFLTLDIARGLLTPIDDDHYLYMKHNNLDDLRKRATENPVELVKLMLKSFNTSLSATQIKTYLEGVVEKAAINKFWERTRKLLEKDGNIKISGKSLKTYDYIGSEVDRIALAITAFNNATEQEKYLLAEEYLKKIPEAFDQIFPVFVKLGNTVYKTNPGLALDILMLSNDAKGKAEFSYTTDTILDSEEPRNIIKNMNSFSHQKAVIRAIKRRNPENWSSVFHKLMFTTDNSKILEEFALQLSSSPDKLKDFYQTVFSIPKRYPQQFQWMLKKIQGGELQEYLHPSYLCRLIDSLNYMKGVKGTINKILSLERFDSIVQHVHDNDIRRLLDSISSNTVLDEYRKRNFTKIIEYHFPHLFSSEKEVIFTTKKALRKKQEELKHLIEVEIPENRKEIGRAREYGDLSENFEYKAAKEKQAQLHEKVRNLESQLNNTKIIDTTTIDSNCVGIGTKVVLKNLTSSEQKYYIVLGRWDTDLKKNIISIEAPVAQSFLGKKCGEHVRINDTDYEIVKIDKWRELG